VKTKAVLLEIGTEEIPARFLPGALASLKDIAASEFGRSKIGFGGVRTYATPRRLALLVDGVHEMQEGRVEEVFGPPQNAAFDENGKPTEAVIGFARSQGIKPEDLVVKKKGKGEYVVAVIEEKGLPVMEVLPEVLKKIVQSLHFPKTMRWGDGTMRFARPIHWIVALYGNDVVGFEIEGIKSGKLTWGHRFLSAKKGGVAVKNTDSYKEVLRKHYVIVDQDERRDLILKQAGELASSVSGTSAQDDELLSIVACLVECPVSVLGSFSENYLELPDELLSSVMTGHQKYFPVKDAEGKLKNYFIVVSNTKEENADTVRAGAERVIRARFEDARFYYDEDRKTTLASRLEALRGVTFHDRLGTLYDKTTRNRTLAGSLAEGIRPETKDSVERAALLSKTDLVTGVVKEFPELQGVMGRCYALNDGEDLEVAQAVMEYYLPAFSGDRVPEGDVGALAGLADRLDNIAAFFSIDLKPTGSEDPFALRRQALAVMAILIDKGYQISVRRLLGAALEGLKGIGPGDLEREILRFFEQRLEGLLDSKGYSLDLVQSVIGLSADVPLSEIISRLDALQAFKSHSAYNDFLMAIKRVRNITPEEELSPVDGMLLKAEEEQDLMRALESAKAVEDMIAESNYAGALERLLELTGPVNNFFDKVLVMDEDMAVRGNRLALLKDIWATVSALADFSKLSEGA
jgi:glycyl-tRNA synthetase beta chain